MKLLRTFALLSILISILVLNWNCKQDDYISSTTNQNSKNSDGILDSPDVTVELVVIQNYLPGGDCPTALNYPLIDITYHYTGGSFSATIDTMTTMDSIITYGGCGTYYTTGWTIKRYVTWSNTSINTVASWWVNLNDTHYYDISSGSGYYEYFTKAGLQANLRCNANFDVRCGLTGMKDDL
jgi:hypothetical protein